MALVKQILLLTSILFLTNPLLGGPITKSTSRDRNDRLYRVVCQHVSWSFYRPGNGKFGVEDIDPGLCTHLIYAYAGIHNNRVRSLDGFLDLEGDYGKGNYKKFNELRELNPRLTTLLGVGGKNEGSIKFSEMSKDSAKRKLFVQSALDMVRQYDFDGINLDWQFPANRGGVPEDKERFTRLLQDLREALKPDGYVLTATVASRKDTIDEAYDVKKISELVDFMNVVSYDYQDGGNKRTALNSPLYHSALSADKEQNVNFSIGYWLERGAPFDKIVLGISFYARSWTLATSRFNSLNQNVTGPGESGPYTIEAGILGYNEVCEFLSDGGWIVTWQPDQRGSYATKGNQWNTYDDPRSVAEKAQYVKEFHLGGVFLHGIESDDARGQCSTEAEKFPLLTSAYKVLHGEERPTTTTTVKPDTSSTTGTTPSTTKAPIDFVCPHVGFFRDPLDCTRYFQCIRTGWTGKYSIIEFRCGSKLVFDQRNTVCNWRHLVPECMNEI